MQFYIKRQQAGEYMALLLGENKERPSWTFERRFINDRNPQGYELSPGIYEFRTCTKQVHKQYYKVTEDYITPLFVAETMMQLGIVPKKSDDITTLDREIKRHNKLVIVGKTHSDCEEYDNKLYIASFSGNKYYEMMHAKEILQLLVSERSTTLSQGRSADIIWTCPAGQAMIQRYDIELTRYIKLYQKLAEMPDNATIDYLNRCLTATDQSDVVDYLKRCHKLKITREI